VENTLKKIRLDGTQAQALVPVSPPGRSADWSSDGTIIVYSDGLDGGGLWRVRETGGELEPIANSGGPNLDWLDVLPNGQAVITSIGNSSADSVIAISLETGERKPLLPGLSPQFVSTGHLVYWRDNALWTVPFDQERLETTGSAMPVVEGVGIGINALAEFAVGGETLFYRQSALTLGSMETVPLWVGPNGDEEVLDPSLSGRFGSPSISPDGRKIAFEYRATGDGTTDIGIYDLDQRTLSSLTFEGENRGPFWSPDGSEVGFSSNRAGRMALYARPADMSREARLLLADPDADLVEGSWTPSGSSLVYTRSLSGGLDDLTDVWQLALDPGNAAVPILETPAVERNPALSPDGRWLAYVSDEEGFWDVYVRPFPGPGGRIKVSTEGGLHPVWAHSGNELFYLPLDERWTPGSWIGATIRADPTPHVQSRTERFPWRASYVVQGSQRLWDVSPDDQRILVLGLLGSAEADGRYVVVHNFGEELKRLTPE
jgi:hypothetical protein